MQCERCGKEIGVGAEFCPYCGYKVERTEEEKKVAEEARAGNRCLKCGKELENSVKFCPSCGTKAGESGNSVTQNPAQPVKKIVYVRTCKNCGTKVPTSEYYCPTCHAIMGTQSSGASTKSYGEDKGSLGFWTGLFFGLIALLVGVCMYPSGSTERTTFVGGWLKSLIVTLIIGVVLFIAISCGVGCLAFNS